ncbi:MinD/ParA family ATP-binding protein [Micromonospora halophytica]|uniref:MinD/ParA family ATP-binding protein n=1 Tax=Micromonospora halophytica TaxID=47864 RepID=UPI001FDF668A|nr:chromosome partitioning protein [Micromonospora halophytica]
MDENADRARLPGQQPVPERDIEPLWPPDATDSAPAWGGPPSMLYPSLTAEVGGPPATPGRTPPPPDGDWPSLQAEPTLPQPYQRDDGSGATNGYGHVGAVANGTGSTSGHEGGASHGAGTAARHGRAAAHGSDPDPGHGSGASHGPYPAWPGPDAGPDSAGVPERAVPVPRVGQPAPVDLDLPFTLDQPMTSGPVDARRPDPGPTHAGEQVDAPATGLDDHPADPVDDHPADPVQVYPATADPQTGPVDTGPAPDGGTADSAPGTPVVPAETSGVTQRESPWAQPPQRLSAAAGEEAVGSAAVPGQPEKPPPAPKLGPFPPSPGTPFSPPVPPTEYPPGPTLAVPPPQPAPAPPQPGPARPHLAPAPHPAPGPPGPAPAQAAGWYQPAWQQGTPPAGMPQQPPARQPAGPPEPAWTPAAGPAPTAEDFARRRQARPADPVATMGVRAVVNRIGLVKLPPGRHEQEVKRDIEMVRRNFGGLRQVTVVNPKGGAGKTVAILLLAMTFGQKRGGYVLAWDNNETQGTLGMRAQQDFHSRTVRDMLRDLGQFQGAHGRIGDLSQYVRSQGEGMFDVLASDESATGGEMLTAAAFAEIREVVSRFYKLIFVDTGNNVRAQNWQAAMDATDQLVVTMSARNDSAETAARMLDHLEQSGRQRLVRQAVTVVSMPPSRKEIDLPAIQEHFAARTRAVLLAPYERLIDTGEPIRYGGLSSATRDAWLKIAAAVAEGL